jgi:hypothetical protein
MDLDPSDRLLEFLEEIFRTNSRTNLFTPEEITLLKDDQKRLYISGKSLKLISHYLQKYKKNVTLRSVVHGSVMQFPKFKPSREKVSCPLFPFLLFRSNHFRTHS